MKRSHISLSIFACLLALATVSCGKQDSGSADLDMGVSSNGLILATDAQSCVDVSSVTTPPTRSLTAPVLRFGGFSLVWKNKDYNLYVGQIKITVKSAKLTGGKYVSTLDTAEVEALIGATNSTLTKATDAEIASAAGGKVYASNSTSKEPPASGTGALRPCALSVGSLAVADKTSSSSYTAQVQIELVGTAFKPDDPTSETVVRKSISTTATAY